MAISGRRKPGKNLTVHTISILRYGQSLYPEMHHRCRPFVRNKTHTKRPTPSVEEAGRLCLPVPRGCKRHKQVFGDFPGCDLVIHNTHIPKGTREEAFRALVAAQEQRAGSIVHKLVHQELMEE